MASAWTWKRRMFWFSMRKRRRAEIHFWGGKEVGEGVWVKGWGGWEGWEVEMARHHFQRRWPEAETSGVPRMCVQWVQRSWVSEV